MFHQSFVSPLFGNSREFFPPLIILPKRKGNLLSRNNLLHFSRSPPFMLHFGITEFSGYDPPWRYEQKSLRGAAEKQYPTMSIEEICALPVADIAAKDSALFLWATFPQLKEAFRVISAWGFKYKTLAFLWLKQNRKADTWFYGMGFWTRSNAEVCLLATKGHPSRQCAGIHQFVISHIERHSKKPDEVRDKIVRLMGDLPRIELFARQKTIGWDVWGNEVECDITIPEKKEETL